MSGLVHPDKYKRQLTADWSSLISTQILESSVAFISFVPVLARLHFSIPKFCNIASVYLGCPIQIFPVSEFCLTLTPRK